jgi:FKBP-type peptidyl-prolyl cis-trans isomerase SlyD
MKIEAGCRVSLNVRMSDAQGHLLEETDAALVYLHGVNDIFPAVERALAGRQAGERIALQLEPEQAFGDYDVERVHVVDCAQLGPDVGVGLQVEGLPGQAGDERIYRVTDVSDEVAVLDGNHPLAGYALRFEIEVVAVERASADELAAATAPQAPDFLRVLAGHDRHADDDRHRH